eukprot:7453417-Heterocapsa_arctica.AAC.1
MSVSAPPEKDAAMGSPSRTPNRKSPRRGGGEDRDTKDTESRAPLSEVPQMPGAPGTGAPRREATRTPPREDRGRPRDEDARGDRRAREDPLGR